MSDDGHLSLETLLELVEGELTSAEAEKAREHLVRCAECLDRSRSLLALSDPPAGIGKETLEAQRPAAWRELSRALPALRPTKPLAAGPRAEARSAPFYWSLAAAMIASAVGGYWLGLRESAPAGENGSELTAATSIQLLPQDFALLGTQPDPPPVACPRVDEVPVLILGGLEGRAGEQFEIELQGPHGRSLKTRASSNEFGEVALALRRSLVGRGLYVVKVRSAPEGPASAPGAAPADATSVNDRPVKEYRLFLDCSP